MAACFISHRALIQRNTSSFTKKKRKFYVWKPFGTGSILRKKSLNNLPNTFLGNYLVLFACALIKILFLAF